MELENVKQVFINEGEVKKILKGDVVMWQKNNVIHLTKSKTEPVTDFLAGWYSEVTFPAEYDTAIGTPEWSVSGLPEGLSYMVTDEGLMIYGYASEPGTHEIAVTASLNGYSDTRTYTFTVDSSEYGIDITTSNEEYITDFELNKYASKTFEAVFNVPPEEQDSEEVWEFKWLPDGLSASGATISGTVTKKGTGLINVMVRKGSYHKQKSFHLARYGIEVYGTSMSNTAGSDNFEFTCGAIDLIIMPDAIMPMMQSYCVNMLFIVSITFLWYCVTFNIKGLSTIFSYNLSDISFP